MLLERGARRVQLHAFDGRGRLIRVDETHLALDDDAGTHSTYYRHDALDQLVALELLL